MSPSRAKMCKQDLKRPNGAEAGGQRAKNEEGDPGVCGPSDGGRTASQRAVNGSHLFIQAAFTFVQSPAHFLSKVSAYTKRHKKMTMKSLVGMSK